MHHDQSLVAETMARQPSNRLLAVLFQAAGDSSVGTSRMNPRITSPFLTKQVLNLLS
jgi:hypothetical protein